MQRRRAENSPKDRRPWYRALRLPGTASALDTARKILALFTRRERRRLAGVLAAIIVVGLLQVAGVGSIVPFVSLLSDRALVQENFVLSWVYETLGFARPDAFLIFVGVCVLVLLVAGNAFMAFTTWLIARFAWDNQRRLSIRLLAAYLGQPYEAFLGRNTADTGKNVLYESQQFTGGVLIPGLNALAHAVTALFIACLLLALNPFLAGLVGLTFGVAYLIVYRFVRRPLFRIGRRRMAANTERFKAVGEAFGSLKEVKVLGREADFVARYEPAARSFADDLAAQHVLAQLPRYGIEALAFGFVMGLFLYLLASRGSVQAVLPAAGAFALAGYRLLPALQQMYYGVSAVRFNQSVVDTVHGDLVTSVPAEVTSQPAGSQGRQAAAGGTPAAWGKRLPFRETLRLEGVGYTYPGAGEPALRDIHVTIPRDGSVAFIGATGCGKTTLADVILGLLRPQAGAITVDGAPIDSNNVRAWQANLGYVPQEIYLTDDTIAANIAYGVPADAVDPERFERAARIANIHDFIAESLPKGYETVVGERGVRLSGGQRQRICIARALYQDPAVLVLDEATSALDNETEQRIVEELNAMRGARTLIVIAHRLSTVRRCERLFLLDRGRIVASGSYEDLQETSVDFRRMVDRESRSVLIDAAER